MCHGALVTLVLVGASNGTFELGPGPGLGSLQMLLGSQDPGCTADQYSTATAMIQNDDDQDGSRS